MLIKKDSSYGSIDFISLEFIQNIETTLIILQLLTP